MDEENSKNEETANAEETTDANSVAVEVEDEATETDTLTANDIDCDPKAALTEEPSKVKFLPAAATATDTKLVVETEKMFLDKDDLMKYVNNPFWVMLRYVIFIAFWLIWLAMLVISIVLVVIAPKCPERSWWQKSPIYEVYVRSFKDSNGDGIGDLRGLESKLDYIKDLGIETVWISPIYKSPMADFGYDVEDYRAIDPVFGTMADFESLVSSMKKRNMKLLMDFIPNHSSSEHEWFKRSERSEMPYADYYIWENPKKGERPSNWLSNFGGSAWTWNPKRQQYYYHAFLDKQPDLNLRNPRVVQELKDIMKFWLDKGIHGFRMDAVKFLIEDIQFRDEPRSNNPEVNSDDYEYLDHIHTTNMRGTFDVLREFREFIDEYNKTDDFERIMVTEAYDNAATLGRYYGTVEKPIAHFPFNFGLITKFNRSNFNGQTLNETINDWLKNMPSGNGWANWVLGNHDVKRVATRFDNEYVDIMNMILLLLPGTPVTYYGEEIGMSDVRGISYKDTQDPFGINAGKSDYRDKSRDPCRSPMQWSNATYAGFSYVKPWLPVNNEYKTVNVEAQKKNRESHLKLYKELVKLRKENTFLFSNATFPVVNKDIFSFARIMPGAPGYCVLVNLGDISTEVDLSEAKGIPEFVSVFLPKKPKGQMVKHSSSKVPIEAKTGIVLQFPPKIE